MSLSQAEAPPVDLFDLARVEVLKGPQGTLYGQAAMGGTIRLITTDPEATEFSGKVRIGATKFDQGDSGENYAAALNVPLIEDELAIRVVGSVQNRAAFTDLVNLAGDTLEEDINFYDSKHWRAKALWTPGDELTVRLSYFHNEDDNRLGNQVDFDKIERLGVGAEALFNTLLQNEVDITTLFVSYDMEIATFEQTISNTQYEVCQQFSIPNAFSGAFCEQNDIDYLESRLVSSSDGPFNWIVGGTYLDGTRDRPSFIEVPAIPLAVNDITFIEAESWGIFGEASYEFMDGFAMVLVGLRYFEDERTMEEILLPDGPGNINTGISTFTDDQSTDTVNPRFNVTFRPSEDTNIYFNAAKGFRPGGVSSVAVRGAALADLGLELSTWESDELWTYELGAKATLLGGALYAEAAIYHTDWEDALFQVQDQSSITGVAIATNVGDAEITGLEFSLVYATPLEGLDVSFSGNIASTELDPLPQIEAAITGITDGGDLPGVPKRTFNLGLDYTSILDSGNELYGRVDVSYRSKQTNASGVTLTPLGDSTVADSFSLVNARIGMRTPEDWDVALHINNLTGEDGLMSFAYALFPAVIRPTEYGISLTKEF